MFVRILIIAFLSLVLAWSALTRTSEGAGPPRRYVVQPADTLWSIASREYGGDPRSAIWRIERANHLRASLLRPGQVLVLP